MPQWNGLDECSCICSGVQFCTSITCNLFLLIHLSNEASFSEAFMPYISPCMRQNSKCLFNSYTMGTSGLPDIYTQSLRDAGVRAEGQTMSVHGITTM